MTHSDSAQWERQRELLSAHLDGALEQKDDATLQAHVATCADCQHELAALRQTRALVRALPSPALPRSFTLSDTPEVRRARIRPVPGWARPTQRLGGVAAMIGAALLCGSALPSLHFGATASSNSAAAPKHSSPQYAGSASSVPRTTATLPAQANQTDQSNATTTPQTNQAGATITPQTAGENSKYQQIESQPEQPFPILPVSGGVLLVGGIGAAVAGGMARRRPRAVR